MAVFVILLSLLLPLAVSALFLPTALRFLGGIAGHYRQRSSRTRRELLLERVASEQKQHESQQQVQAEKDEDDWEEIEGSMVGSAVNGGKADREWHGIVGFFHPFW
jgi:alpha-1,2-mannosyltransferase